MKPKQKRAYPSNDDVIKKLLLRYSYLPAAERNALIFGTEFVMIKPRELENLRVPAYDFLSFDSLPNPS